MMRMTLLRPKQEAAASPHAEDVVSLDRDLTFMDEPAAPAMVLQLGDIFPDFMANGTTGTFRLHQWARGHWVHLFTQPEPFHPVGTSEIMGFVQHAEDFAALGVKHLCLSGFALHFQTAWTDAIENAFGIELDFPQIEDPTGDILTRVGMGQTRDSTGSLVRKSLVLDPELRLRVVFDYPINLGRSIREILRVIEGLQTASEMRGICLPADWEDGAPMLLSPQTSKSAADESYKNLWHEVTPWYRTVDF